MSSAHAALIEEELAKLKQKQSKALKAKQPEKERPTAVELLARKCFASFFLLKADIGIVTVRDGGQEENGANIQRCHRKYGGELNLAYRSPASQPNRYKTFF
jgi:hypothetical protein